MVDPITTKLTIIFAGLMGLALVACGPSTSDIDRRIDQRVREALAGVPTFPAMPTPLATVTPAPTATPQPTPTAVSFPSTPTPLAFPPPPSPQPTATPQPIVDFNRVQELARASVFVVETRRSVGTGWLIEPDLILTNEHAIQSNAPVTIRQAGHPAFTASVVAFDAQLDIALLTFQPDDLAPGAEPLPLGQISSDDIARPLLALGYSTREVNGDGSVAGATANVGVLSQVVDLGNRRRGRNLNLVMDAPVDPGDSGGPVLDASGEVVGMSRAVQEQTERGQRVVGTFYAVHVDEIRNALPALKRGESR